MTNKEETIRDHEQAYEADIKRQESNRIAALLEETLTWDIVANHMKRYDYDPYDCQLNEVMLSIRKLMRTVVQVVEDDEVCAVCGKLCEGHGEL